MRSCFNKSSFAFAFSYRNYKDLLFFILYQYHYNCKYYAVNACINLTNYE